MKKLKIGVVFGGMSTEHDVSIVSATSIIESLNKEKYDILPIYIDQDGKWFKYTKNVEDIKILDIGEKLVKRLLNSLFIFNVHLLFPVPVTNAELSLYSILMTLLTFS